MTANLGEDRIASTRLRRANADDDGESRAKPLRPPGYGPKSKAAAGQTMMMRWNSIARYLERILRFAVEWDIPPGLFALAVYVRTLAQGVYGFDSAELATGAYTLGIVHPTGYPTYLMLAKLFTFLPVENVAYRVNLLSAVLGAGTVWLLARLATRISGSRWAGWVGAGMLAFAYSFWSMSIVAEVYTLHTALIALCLLLLDQWIAKDDNRYLYGLALVFGLSLTNHISAILFVPLFAWPVLTNIRRLDLVRVVPRCAFLFLIGLIPYLYLPMRYAADPPLNYVRTYYEIDLTTVEGLLWMITGRAYGFFAFGYDLNAYLGELLKMGDALWRNFTGLGVLLGLIGVASLLLRRKKMVLPIIFGFAANIAFFAGYAVGDKNNMLLGAWLLWAIFVAEGARTLIDSLRKVSFQNMTMPRAVPKVGAGLMIISVFVMAAANARWLDMSRAFGAELYARQILSTVPEGSLVMGPWSSSVVLEYFQEVEGLRPDVEIFNRSRFEVAEYYKHWSHGTPHEIAIEFVGSTESQFVQQQMQDRAVYDLEFEPRLATRFEYQPIGRVFLVTPKNSSQTN